MNDAQKRRFEASKKVIVVGIILILVLSTFAYIFLGNQSGEPIRVVQPWNYAKLDGCNIGNISGRLMQEYADSYCEVNCSVVNGTETMSAFTLNISNEVVTPMNLSFKNSTCSYSCFGYSVGQRCVPG